MSTPISDKVLKRVSGEFTESDESFSSSNNVGNGQASLDIAGSSEESSEKDSEESSDKSNEVEKNFLAILEEGKKALERRQSESDLGRRGTILQRRPSESNLGKGKVVNGFAEKIVEGNAPRGTKSGCTIS